MLQFNLTRQEKSVLLVVALATLLGIGINFLFKMMPRTSEIYNTSFDKPLKVNINTASVDELIKLPEIGPKTAERIMDFRGKNGKFSEISQLKQIQGITDKKLTRIKEFLILEEPK